MMTTTPTRLSIAMTAILTFTTILPVRAQEAPQPEDPEADAGTFFYDGGAVIAKRARTRTTAFTTDLNNQWVNVPSATLTYTVPFFPFGIRRLFNVHFSAECSKVNAGSVLIRVIDTVGVSPLEPNDGGRVLCSGGQPQATHTAIWVKNATPGIHTLRVQILKFTPGPARIDDYAFELVVHTNP
jgi:hypothetical protein